MLLSCISAASLLSPFDFVVAFSDREALKRTPFLPPGLFELVGEAAHENAHKDTDNFLVTVG
jgi:hypothetical protein